MTGPTGICTTYTVSYILCVAPFPVPICYPLWWLPKTLTILTQPYPTVPPSGKLLIRAIENQRLLSKNNSCGLISGNKWGGNGDWSGCLPDGLRSAQKNVGNKSLDLLEQKGFLWYSREDGWKSENHNRLAWLGVIHSLYKLDKIKTHTHPCDAFLVWKKSRNKFCSFVSCNCHWHVFVRYVVVSQIRFESGVAVKSDRSCTTAN